MTIETRNPIPAGRYWIEVSNEPIPTGTWLGFLDAFRGFVHVENTEQDEAFTFSIFATSKPLVWPEGIGLPNVAPPSVRSRADTVQAPDPEPEFVDTLPAASQLVSSVSGTIQLAVWVLVAFVGVRILANAGRHGKK